jgi:hypothetical protein
MMWAFDGWFFETGMQGFDQAKHVGRYGLEIGESAKDINYN